MNHKCESCLCSAVVMSEGLTDGSDGTHHSKGKKDSVVD